MNPSFVHLRLHSEYSLVDGIVRLDDLVPQCAKLGMPAVAVTDQCNLYGLVKFYKAAQSVGVKPIAGSDFLVVGKKPEDTYSRICLLVCSQQGYKNLIALISRAYLEGQRHGVAYVQREWITEHAEGLIALSGGREGDIGQALTGGRDKDAKKLLQACKKISRSVFIWNCKEPVVKGKKNIYTRLWRWRSNVNARWWRRTMYAFLARRNLKHTKHECVLLKGACWMMRVAGVVIAKNNI